MPDYKTMYFKLFNAVTDAVKILSDAQAEAEEIFIETSEINNLNSVNFEIVEGKDSKR